jgi:hypothetical protein
VQNVSHFRELQFASLQNVCQKMQAAAAFAREWAATPALKAAEDDGHCQE